MIVDTFPVVWEGVPSSDYMKKTDSWTTQKPRRSKKYFSSYAVHFVPSMMPQNEVAAPGQHKERDCVPDDVFLQLSPPFSHLRPFTIANKASRRHTKVFIIDLQHLENISCCKIALKYLYCQTNAQNRKHIGTLSICFTTSNTVMCIKQYKQQFCVWCERGSIGPVKFDRYVEETPLCQANLIAYEKKILQHHTVREDREHPRRYYSGWCGCHEMWVNITPGEGKRTYYQIARGLRLLSRWPGTSWILAPVRGVRNGVRYYRERYPTSRISRTTSHRTASGPSGENGRGETSPPSSK